MLDCLSPLWTHEDVLKVTRGEAFGPSTVSSGCAIDSRDVCVGDLFVAIKGKKTDGHHFIKEALDRGASKILIDHWPSFLETLNLSQDISVVVVGDTFEALWALARYARGRLRPDIKIAAVTGSVGKTTTKVALAHILKDQGCVAASAKSLNTKLGVPLSLIRASERAEYGVFEIGMSQKGEIAPLSELVKPHVAMITMLAPAHFGAFESLEKIAREKSDIIKGLSPEGKVILNGDMPFFKEIVNWIPHEKKTFGRAEGSDLRLLGVGPGDFGFLEVKAQFKEEQKPFTYVIQAIGEHFAYNTLGALLVARTLGADMEKAKRSLETFTPEVRRGQYEILHHGGREMVLLDESYNANPTSMKVALKALSYFPKWRKGRMVAVLGDMLDLGEKSEAFHRGLSHDIKENNIDAVFTCGEMMKHLNKALPNNVQKTHVETSRDLFEQVKMLLREGDNIMVKGSLGMKMDVFVKALKGE